MEAASAFSGKLTTRKDIRVLVSLNACRLNAGITGVPGRGEEAAGNSSFAMGAVVSRQRTRQSSGFT